MKTLILIFTSVLLFGMHTFSQEKFLRDEGPEISAIEGRVDYAVHQLRQETDQFNYYVQYSYYLDYYTKQRVTDFYNTVLNLDYCVNSYNINCFEEFNQMNYYWRYVNSEIRRYRALERSVLNTFERTRYSVIEVNRAFRVEPTDE